jgi:HK97 family phage prohead protease
VASTSAVDRADDIVEQDWELDDFRKNPVILWAHRYDLAPVGKALGVEVRDSRLVASVQWDAAGHGAEIARQVKGGFLSAVSVGFYPGASIPRRSLPDGDPRKAEWGYIHSKCRLIEISVVPVPANPEALAISRGAQGSSPRVCRSRAATASSSTRSGARCRPTSSARSRPTRSSGPRSWRCSPTR